MNYPGDLADPKDVAAWMAYVAKTEYGLPGILPVMTSCVELTQAWTGPGDVKDVDGYLYSADWDSLGYFQQRPSQGWGTPDQLINADYALRAFCKEAVKYKGQYSTTDSDGLGQWCQAVQRSGMPNAYRDKGFPMAKDLLLDWSEKSTMVTAEDLIATGRALKGASYGQWDGYWPPSAGAPFWMYGAVSVDLVLEYGCNCAGYINAIRRINGLDALGGTGSIGDRLINLLDFDVTTPAIPGAIALRPWTGGVADVNEGHVALYTSEHDLLQADHRGVNEDDTDYDSQPWAQFTVYGLMDDVLYEDYPGSDDPPAWQRWGWYEAINAQWDLKWHAPEKG